MREGSATGSIERLQQERSFEDLTFTALDLQGLDLGAREFTGCSFHGCKVQETRWKGSRLDECRFERCDLTRMQPRGVLAHDVRFSDSKLMGVEWTELGQFPRLGFVDCVLDFASFVALSLRKTEFRGCKIEEANFFDTDLREADFAGCDLRGSMFRGCKLGKTDFSAATGVFFDPAINEARGAIVPIETAALLAMHLGLHVADYSAPVRERATPAARGRARRA
jgi:fluoroquinolone resistance protein